MAKEKQKVIVGNAWSITMLQRKSRISFEPVSLEQAREFVKGQDVQSIIGHPGTAEVFSRLLEVELPANRVFYKMRGDEIMVIGSLNQRLPEGKVLSAMELENIPVKWWIVKKEEDR